MDESAVTVSVLSDPDRSGYARSDTTSDSSFYGCQAVKDEYNTRARNIDTYDYWRVYQWNLQVKAAEEIKRNPQKWELKSKKRKLDQEMEDAHHEKKARLDDKEGSSQNLSTRNKSTEPFNPYEGDSAALQLGESVESFLARLDPCSADIPQPWIQCANFHASYRPAQENIAEFRRLGQNLLDKFMSKRHDLENSFEPPKSEGVITRMLSNERKQLEIDILRLAERNNIIGGKWLLFPGPNKVRTFWEAVVRATAKGLLGSSAKVATKPNANTPGDNSQVICVYTENFANEGDVKRVLKELIRLNLADAVVNPPRNFKPFKNAKSQIYYKPNAYTHLDIMGQNEYKIKTSLWSTSSLLTTKDI